MTHRGAVGADIRDGDGAGVMTAIPHEFYVQQLASLDAAVKLPAKGRYAVGNIFMNPNFEEETKRSFEQIARDLGLHVLCWRPIPRNSEILGPVSKSNYIYNMRQGTAYCTTFRHFCKSI